MCEVEVEGEDDATEGPWAIGKEVAGGCRWWVEEAPVCSAVQQVKDGGEGHGLGMKGRSIAYHGE